MATLETAGMIEADEVEVKVEGSETED